MVSTRGCLTFGAWLGVGLISFILLAGASNQIKVWLIGPEGRDEFYYKLKNDSGPVWDYIHAFEGEEPFPHNTAPADEYGREYVLSYYMHIMPAVVWTLLAPWQLSKTTRSLSLTLHRWLGRLFFLLSLSIGISGFCYPFFDVGFALTYAEGGLLGSHQFTVQFWGTFFLISLYLAYNHARNRNIHAHRKWVMRHVALGMGVMSMRFHYFLVGMYGVINELPAFTEYERKLAFAYTLHSGVVMNLVFVELWLWAYYPNPNKTSAKKGVKQQ